MNKYTKRLSTQEQSYFQDVIERQIHESLEAEFEFKNFTLTDHDFDDINLP